MTTAETNYVELKAAMAAAGFTVSEGEGFNAQDLASHRDYSHFVIGKNAVHAAYDLAYGGPQAAAAPAVEAPEVKQPEDQTVQVPVYAPDEAPAAQTMTLEIAPSLSTAVAPEVKEEPLTAPTPTYQPAPEPAPEEQKEEPAPQEPAPAAQDDAPPADKAEPAPAEEHKPAVDQEDKAAE